MKSSSFVIGLSNKGREFGRARVVKAWGGGVLGGGVALPTKKIRRGNPRLTAGKQRCDITNGPGKMRKGKKEGKSICGYLQGWRGGVTGSEGAVLPGKICPRLLELKNWRR